MMRAQTFFAAIVLCSACYSKADGARLARQAERHAERLTALERGIEEERREIQLALQNAEGKVRELEQVLEQATDVVTRNSADLGTQVRDLRSSLQHMEGTVAELRNDITQTQRQIGESSERQDQALQQMARRAGVDMPVDPSEVPDDVDAHYQAATAAFQNSEHSRARALYREFVSRYPDHDNVDNALYFIGKSYLDQGRPASALGEFRTVIREHRNGDAADETLYAMGQAFYALHSCTDARSVLGILIQNYRRSPHRDDARSLMREIQRNSDSCTS